MKKNSEDNLKILLNPASIALIGASRNPSKIGAIILRNIIYNGFNGKIYPVNPYAKELYNYNSFPDIKSINVRVDMAIIATPSDVVEDHIQQCLDAGVKVIMVVGTGYAESGKNGIKLQQNIVKMCSDAGAILIGPNTSGIVNILTSLNASMIPNLPEKGNSSLITQSGSIASELVDYAHNYNLGLKEIINVGNKASIDELDFLNYYLNLDDSASLHGLGLALENISDGKAFINTVSKLVLKTAVIAMLSGNSKAAKEQIRLHTGVVRQKNFALELALKQSGCLVVETEKEMFDLLLSFSWQPVMKGSNVSVVTNTGGGAVIAADEIGKQNLTLFELPEDLHNFISHQLGRATQFDQVIDLEGKSIVDRIGTVVDEVFAEKDVHAVLVILAAHNIADLNEIAGILGLLSRIHKKTMVVAFMGGGHIEEGKKILAKQFIPSFENISQAVKVLGQMNKYFQIRQVKENTTSITSGTYLQRFEESTIKDFNEILSSVGQNTTVNYSVLRKLINKAGYNISENHTFSTIEELYDAAENMGMPVTFKCPNGRKDSICRTKEDLKRQFKDHLNCGRDYSDVLDSTLDIVHGHTLERVYSDNNIFEIKLTKDDYSEHLIEGIAKDVLDQLSFGYTMNLTFMGFGRRYQVQAIATENKQEIADLVHKEKFIKYTGLTESDWFKAREKFIWSVQNAVRIVNTLDKVNEFNLKGVFDRDTIVMVDYSCSIAAS